MQKLWIALLGWTVSLGATAGIEYTVVPIAGNAWRYNYAISNDGAEPLREITIWFEPATYSALSSSASPADWDSLVIQPDSQIPADGFLDTLSLATGIGVGASVQGWSVDFAYSGAGAPGSQRFSFIDPVTFAEISGGLTVVSIVPEPATTALFLGGAICLFGWSRRLSSTNCFRPLFSKEVASS